jgi:hypothetical protein
MLAGTRAQIDEVVGRADRFLVVLDHEHGVAEIAQLAERRKQRRLSRWCRPIDGSSSTYSTPVKLRSDLRRQPDALALAARQRRGAAPDSQIPDADIEQKPQPVPDFPHHAAGNGLLPFSQFQRLHEFQRIRHGHVDELREMMALDLDGAAFRRKRAPSQAGHGCNAR